jgi:hypothetical protein
MTVARQRALAVLVCHAACASARWANARQLITPLAAELQGQDASAELQQRADADPRFAMLVRV